MYQLAVSSSEPHALPRLLDIARAIPAWAMPSPAITITTQLSSDGATALLGWDDGRPARTAFGWSGDAVQLHTDSIRSRNVFVARSRDCVVVADRGLWAAWATGELVVESDFLVDLCSFGHGLDAVSPWRGVTVVGPDRVLSLRRGTLDEGPRAVDEHNGDVVAKVAVRLVGSLESVRSCSSAVLETSHDELATLAVGAALLRTGIPFTVRDSATSDPSVHPGRPRHIAHLLGVALDDPAPRGATSQVADEDEMLTRIRSTVLLGDGEVSAATPLTGAFPGWNDRGLVTPQASGLVRGGYATTARSSRWVGMESFRGITNARRSLLTRSSRTSVDVRLAPWWARLAAGSQRMLDRFYAVNRAGRADAALGAALSLERPTATPFLDGDVYGLASRVDLDQRIDGRLLLAVLRELAPDVARAYVDGHTPTAGPVPGRADLRGLPAAEAPAPLMGRASRTLLRSYVHDLGDAGGLFDVVDRRAADRVLDGAGDADLTWTLATAACLASGDWRQAREQGVLFRPERS